MHWEDVTTDRRIDRRTLLALAGTTALAGPAAARPPHAGGGTPKPGVHDYVVGETLAVGSGTVRAYATTNPAGNLSSLGVHVDGDAMAAFGSDPVAGHLHFPSSVDTHQFTFMGFHFNPNGHPPTGVYDVEHFDFHFYMLDESIVESITAGPALYSIPSAQIPEDYIRPPLVDTDGDGTPDAPLIEAEMGEHLIDATAPELQPGGTFTHTNIYGAYDPDGDGVGRLTFVEPMVTTAFFDALEDELVVPLKTPEEYFVPDEYPTSYVLEPDGNGGVYVSIDGFESFPGPND